MTNKELDTLTLDEASRQLSELRAALLIKENENLQLQAQNRDLLAHNSRQTAQLADLEARLKQQNTLNSKVELLKRAIVRIVSHELRTPLLQLKSAIALLSEDIPHTSESHNLVVYAENATTRLEGIARNITLLGTSFDMSPSPVILRDTIEYTRRSMVRSWQHRDASERIQLDLIPNLPPVYADKQGISTILHLLLDNALKFSHGKVIVRTSLCDKGALISIQDFGIGITPQQIENIFDIFYQADSSSTRPYGGMGIGLTIVKLILDAHRTVLNIHSELGKGSSFSFSLPFAELS